jgi:ubiquinone/menaquinone biosynthesis C-methylase UbiE
MGLANRFYAATYDRLNASAERGEVGARRAALLGGLAGDVLELGGGTGANLKHYGPDVRLVVTEPDPHMRRRLAAGTGRIVAAAAERLPFPAASFDAVVSTFVLCSVRDQAAALTEVARVLRPGGRLVVYEHVRASGGAGLLQDAVTPFTRLVSGNCHANRRTVQALDVAGFDVAGLVPADSTLLYPTLAGALERTGG